MVVLVAVKQNSTAIFLADESSLINDPDFVFEAACVSIGIMESKLISDELKMDAWSRILERYDNFKGLNIPKNSLVSYETFKIYLKDRYDIEFLVRFRSIDVGVRSSILKGMGLKLSITILL